MNTGEKDRIVDVLKLVPGIRFQVLKQPQGIFSPPHYEIEVSDERVVPSHSLVLRSLDDLRDLVDSPYDRRYTSTPQQ